MLSAGFEFATSAIERLQTYALAASPSFSAEKLVVAGGFEKIRVLRGT
jgi:hypothetical protein